MSEPIRPAPEAVAPFAAKIASCSVGGSAHAAGGRISYSGWTLSRSIHDSAHFGALLPRCNMEIVQRSAAMQARRVAQPVIKFEQSFRQTRASSAGNATRTRMMKQERRRMVNESVLRFSRLMCGPCRRGASPGLAATSGEAHGAGSATDLTARLLPKRRGRAGGQPPRRPPARSRGNEGNGRRRMKLARESCWRGSRWASRTTAAAGRARSRCRSAAWTPASPSSPSAAASCQAWPQAQSSTLGGPIDPG
jgi:hypothetical protein